MKETDAKLEKLFWLSSHVQIRVEDPCIIEDDMLEFPEFYKKKITQEEEAEYKKNTKLK